MTSHDFRRTCLFCNVSTVIYILMFILYCTFSVWESHHFSIYVSKVDYHDWYCSYFCVIVVVFQFRWNYCHGNIFVSVLSLPIYIFRWFDGVVVISHVFCHVNLSIINIIMTVIVITSIIIIIIIMITITIIIIFISVIITIIITKIVIQHSLLMTSYIPDEMVRFLFSLVFCHIRIRHV